MSARTGSYPLMNLAADYGVAYGDVLLWADYMRRRRADPLENFSEGVMERAIDGYRRVHEKLGPILREKLGAEIKAHADARWGRP